MLNLHSIALWPTLAVVIVATVTDLRSRRIPNWLVVPFLLAGLLMSAITHGWSGLGQSLLGVLAAFLTMGIFCYLGGLGMGDLKLCAAIGAWVGPTQLFVALIMTSIAGGIMALCWMIAGGFMTETLGRMGSLLKGFANNGLKPHATIVLSNPAGRKMPYAPAIAIGTIFSFLGKN